MQGANIVRNIATFGTLIMAGALASAPALAQDTGAQDTGATGATAQTEDQSVPPATIDTNGDGKADAWDRDGNGQPDAWDTDGDGAPDKVDDNGDGQPD